MEFKLKHTTIAINHTSLKHTLWIPLIIYCKATAIFNFNFNFTFIYFVRTDLQLILAMHFTYTLAISLVASVFRLLCVVTRMHFVSSAMAKWNITMTLCVCVCIAHIRKLNSFPIWFSAYYRFGTTNQFSNAIDYFLRCCIAYSCFITSYIGNEFPIIFEHTQISLRNVSTNEIGSTKRCGLVHTLYINCTALPFHYSIMSLSGI